MEVGRSKLEGGGVQHVPRGAFRGGGGDSLSLLSLSQSRFS